LSTPNRDEFVILTPVDQVKEVELMVSAGANELYGGVHPKEWHSSILSPNQRNFASAQFESEEAVAEAVAEAKRLGVQFRLTLNAPLYDPTDYKVLMALAERAAKWGVAGIIAGDLGLLIRLAKSGLPLETTVSTLAGGLNRESINFLKQFKVDRIVFPRHLNLAEIKSLVQSHPDIVFEAFVLVGKCPNEEAYCTLQHTDPKKRWPCEIPYDLYGPEGKLDASHPLRRWHDSWEQCDRRNACGLCGVDEVAAMGVKHMKLVGRGAPTKNKLANLELVAGLIRREFTREEARAAYKERFGVPCRALTCYYPELHPDNCRKSKKAASKPTGKVKLKQAAG